VILSHKHKFIFLKTKKAAGTSVEIALSAVCGPDDVITPISPEDEALRRSLGYRGVQNYELPLLPAIGHFFRCGRWLRYNNHMRAFEVQRLAGERIWQEYFTFCFERNPWARALSQFQWLNRDRDDADFGAYIRSGKLDRLQAHTAALYRQGDDILVDRVCRYENFEMELRGISEALGLSEPLKAPHVKSDIHTDAPAFRWRRQDADYIAELFRWEIERFGYLPPESD
jgi:hypothetical protein